MSTTKVVVTVATAIWIAAVLFTVREVVRGIREAKPNRDDGTADRNT